MMRGKHGLYLLYELSLINQQYHFVFCLVVSLQRLILQRKSMKAI
ncbi:hypothetical protein SAMN05444376_1426 [Bacteroides clarus YIT 12056]|nr:hypothetical protein SAMN05444376_1426 [Bacteroides clarus YIT 12056]